MKQFLGNYVGIVIQNDDPQRSGKVKVFVPHVTASVYKNWIERRTNKKFKFMGANIDNAVVQSLSGAPLNQTDNLSTIVEELKLVLPWAHCAAPLTSENGSGRYNNYHNFANISDSNHYSTFSQSTSSAENTPGKPGAFYEKEENRLTDAFVNANQGINMPNPLAYEYVPSTYSNRAKGSFGVPAVGSHVWLFFREGNPTLPVYFAVSYDVVDWRGIYDAYGNPGINYPETFENKNSANTEMDANVETYRNKYVLNQKGGSVEIINTDLNEKLKLTHYSGSFKEFNNQANIELATGNDQKLVLNDSYSTVRGFKNDYTGKSVDEVVGRDKYKKVGSINEEYFNRWKEAYRPIQDTKQLFEIQRATVNNIVDPVTNNIVISRNSVNQKRTGTYAKHPAINQENYSLENDSSNVPVFIQQTQSFVSTPDVDGPGQLSIISLPPSIIKFPSLVNYTLESGITWSDIPGMSTSSQGGVWIDEVNKNFLKQQIEAILPTLTDIEKNLGIGGSEIVQIAKHKIETIGVTINDYGSIRYDKIGKMLTSEMLIDSLGSYMNFEPSPLIEYVHVQDLPGGTYDLNVCNRWNVVVGAGGVNLKSLGAVNISGTVTNVVGEQLNLSSENEVNINAKTINISAEILRLRNTRQRQIFIEDSLGINNNVVIGGGLSVDGEVYLQHVTAPTEYQVTEGTQLYGQLLPGVTFIGQLTIPDVQAGGLSTLSVTDEKGIYPIFGGFTAPFTLTLTTPIPGAVAIEEHSHIFKNLPLTLYDKNSQVRNDAKAINNNPGRAVASRRVHGKK